LIVTPRTILRVAALILIGVVVQLAIVTQFTFWGANADLIPLLVLFVGLLGGPVAGSLVGFFMGLMIDMTLVQTLGVTSLLLTGVGYLGGRYRELRDTSHALVPVAGGALATLLYSASFSVTQFLLGVDSSVSGLVIRDTLVAVLINALLAAPLVVAVRALLRPSLADSFRPRRRSTPIGLRIPS
jgi:rod shape-determining protein MreD